MRIGNTEISLLGLLVIVGVGGAILLALAEVIGKAMGC